MNVLLESWASQALTSSMLVALPVALLAGIVSFASPCVLPLLPGYLSYASGLGSAQIAEGTGSKKLLVGGTLGFVLGFSVIFVLTGAILGGVGAALLTNARAITIALGVVILVLGAGFAGWLPVPSGWRPSTAPRLGVWASPLLGMVFGLGWTPCIGPALSVVLTLALNEGSAVRGGVLAFAYALGLGLPFLAFAVAFTTLAPKLDWLRRHQQTMQRIGGVAMMAVGVAMIVGWWDALVAVLRQWAANFGTIL
ncbi:cytochrome c-type biogenesis protein [Tessaracoccus flavus]|nr:cytochrome c-type biogenesis protein [Tessaracoccus flavus]